MYPTALCSSMLNEHGSFRSGEFVSQFIEPRDDDEELDDAAVQPNGVDLSIKQIYKLEGASTITNGDYEKANRIPITPEDGVFTVEPGTGYVIEYGEIIEIPENHIGIVLPRSRLLRCGLDVTTAFWDSGYRGKGEGALMVSNEAKLTEDLRVAQIGFIRTEELSEHYDGSHQGDGL